MPNPFYQGMNLFSGEFMDKLSAMYSLVDKHEAHYPDLESKLLEPEALFDEEVGGNDIFVALCLGDISSEIWPKKYNWIEARLSGVALSNPDFPDNTIRYDPDENGRSSDPSSIGKFAINRNEMINEFGESVGPWGAILQSPFANLTVMPIPFLQPIVITMETSTYIDPETKEEVTNVIPMFSGENAYTIVCNDPPPGPLGEMRG